jgi:hypothetical protein
VSGQSQFIELLVFAGVYTKEVVESWQTLAGQRPRDEDGQRQAHVLMPGNAAFFTRVGG